MLAIALAQAKQRLVRTGLRHAQIPATERIFGISGAATKG